MPAERLQKLLAQAGLGSRRSCEDLISAGRVHVNGKVATLGDKADPAVDTITLDFEPLPSAEQLIYIALHKPRGVESTLKSQGGLPTVRDLVPVSERVYPVGRLDVDSEGLMLLTNDGDLTNQLTHPRFGSQKEYRIQLRGHPRQEQLDIWRRGVVLPDTNERTAPARVEITKEGASGTWLKVVMHEGKNHQIRRIAETLGLNLKRLIRVRMSSLRLDDLPAGEWRHLTEREVRDLKQGNRRRGGRVVRVRSRPSRDRKPSTGKRPDGESKRRRS